MKPDTLNVVAVVSTVLAFISVFVFPWPFTVFLGAIAAISFPPAALALGLTCDALYYPGTGLPVTSIVGAVGSVVAYMLREFIKNRIL